MKTKENKDKNSKSFIRIEKNNESIVTRIEGDEKDLIQAIKTTMLDSELFFNLIKKATEELAEKTCI